MGASLRPRIFNINILNSGFCISCFALISFWRETSPEGANQESPGQQPWEKSQQQWKP